MKLFRGQTLLNRKTNETFRVESVRKKEVVLYSLKTTEESTWERDKITWRFFDRLPIGVMVNLDLRLFLHRKIKITTTEGRDVSGILTNLEEFVFKVYGRKIRVPLRFILDEGDEIIELQSVLNIGALKRLPKLEEVQL